MTTDKDQTPVPKASSGKKLSEEKTPELKKMIHMSGYGVSKKTMAAKSPQKMQNGKTGHRKS